jgi:hypothetical protein
MRGILTDPYRAHGSTLQACARMEQWGVVGGIGFTAEYGWTGLAALSGARVRGDMMQATSASSYGGYGGNQQDQDIENFKYWFDVPGTWKGEIVTKQQKGYQGIDAVFSNPANKVSGGRLGSLLRANRVTERIRCGGCPNGP